jgi:hypothetical protein
MRKHDIAYQDTSFCRVHSSHFTRGHVYAYHPKVAQGDPHEAYVGSELMVRVALSPCMTVFVRHGSHL